MNQLPGANDRYWCFVFQQMAPGARHEADPTLHTIPMRFISSAEIPCMKLSPGDIPKTKSDGNRSLLFAQLTFSAVISVTYLTADVVNSTERFQNEIVL
jgi:hypothetical protein